MPHAALAPNNPEDRFPPLKSSFIVNYAIYFFDIAVFIMFHLELGKNRNVALCYALAPEYSHRSLQYGLIDSVIDQGDVVIRLAGDKFGFSYQDVGKTYVSLSVSHLK